MSSVETQRRTILTEWRIVMVSQTSNPIMYQIERPRRSEVGPRWFAEGYASVKIPLGNRIITKWQEQVRQIDNENDHWYPVREWTEAEMSRNYNQAANDRNTSSNSHRSRDRTQIQRFLSESGLNPSDYIFSPVPEDNSPQEPAAGRSSAFSSYSSQQQDNQQFLRPQSQSLFTSGRSLQYVQYPPPPTPQPPADQPPPSSNRNQAPSNQQQGPPPPPQSGAPPPSSQTGPSIPSFLANRSAPQPQNTTSPSQIDMSHHASSPYRPPPSPPHFNNNPHDSSLSAEHYLRQINSHETPPVKVVKPNTQNIVYKKEIRIRYLQPPTPPPPAPIIIREKHRPPHPTQSPLLIRERKPEARTPPPLTIRERPPSPPRPLEPYIIEKNIPPVAPQPRQIIIERLPTPPPKPRTVIFEKWLPYKKIKRPVLLQKAPPLEPVKPTRNVVIEYEPSKAFTVRRVIEEGVFRVDPHQYSAHNAQSNPAGGDIRIVERIEDLPPPSEQLMRVLNDYTHSNQHSSPHFNSYDQQSHHNISDHIPSSVQHLLSGAQPASRNDHLASVSRASSTPAHRQDRVHSTGYTSSVASPTFIPLQHSHSRNSNRHLQQLTPRHSPTRSHIDDIY